MKSYRNAARAAALCALLTAMVFPVVGAEGIDPQADKILKSMSSYLANTKAFSINTDVTLEVVLQTGQKVQLCSSQKLLVRRPSEFRIRVKGMVADAEFLFDGKTFTLFGVRRNAYVQRDVPGTIDDAFRKFEYETGIPATGADLLFSDPYPILSSGIESSAYFGIAYVNGIECHHLAFRKNRVDWQIWVQTGDKPLPMKYVITTKWQTGAPQYELILRDWNTSPQVTDKQFTFSAPQGAKKLDAVPIEDMDEFPWTKETE
jgi:hypothetical protein